MAIAPSGWIPTNVEVLRKSDTWGDGRKTSVVRIFMQNDLMYSAVSTDNEYNAVGYMPFPGPSLVGMRQQIDYVIPICPFTRATAAGRWIDWSYEPATGGQADQKTGRIRVLGAFSDAGGPTYPLEVSYGTVVSTFFTTNVMMAFAVVYGG